MEKRPELEELRDRDCVCVWGVKDVGQVLRCQFVEELVGDAIFDGEPVKADEGGGDVLPGFSASENPGS